MKATDELVLLVLNGSDQLATELVRLVQNQKDQLGATATTSDADNLVQRSVRAGGRT